jgi:hypothetical protein
VSEQGVRVDYLLGGKLLQLAILDVMEDVCKLQGR